MKLETFFEKFDQFADAPGAVAKMRELVLELAVRGRLLCSLRPDSSTPSGTSRPFAIPPDWHWVALNNAADCRVAGKVDSASLKDSDWVLDLEDIDGGAGKVIATATFAERRSLSTKASFQKGDVLYGKLRPYLNKVVIADRPGFCTTEIIPLRPQKFVAAGYLRLFLRSPHFLRYAASKNYGMKMPRLGTQDLESADVPLPPLAEQKRIVAKVDELMALCDRLGAQQQAREEQSSQLARASLARFATAPTPANLNYLFHASYNIPPSDLRKSILTLAVRGKLVPQNPNDEPAEKLVARVAAEKRRLVQTKEIKAETPLEPISDEEVFQIPKSWKWVRAGEICRPISSGSTPDQSVFRAMDGVPYLKVYNIRSQAVDFDHKRQFITAYHHEEKMKRSKLVPGDVIMNIVGPPLGKVAIVPDTFPEWNCNQAISFFRPVFPEFATFLYTFLKEGSFLRNIQLIGTAGQDNISVTKCKFIPIPIPPLAEQRRIVAKVDQLMTLVDELETHLTTTRTTAQNLLTALVAELTLSSSEPENSV